MTQVIYGAGGFGAEVWDLVQACHPDGGAQVCFVDDLAPKDPHYRGALYLGTLADAARAPLAPEARWSIAIGSPSVRQTIAGKMAALQPHWAVLIHPDARVSPTAVIGTGSILCLHAAVSSRAKLGKHVVLNIGAVVGHDVTVGDYATVQPGAIVLGSVLLGERVEVGAGAIVYPGIKVGAGAKVGLGAVVVRDVPEGVSVAGNPARVIATHSG